MGDLPETLPMLSEEWHRKAPSGVLRPRPPGPAISTIDCASAQSPTSGIPHPTNSPPPDLSSKLDRLPRKPWMCQQRSAEEGPSLCREQP